MIDALQHTHGPHIWRVGVKEESEITFFMEFIWFKLDNKKKLKYDLNPKE